jgi:SHS2 domain-containing protein
MPYEQLEDGVTADVTYRAWGRDLDELFASAADATVGTMLVSLGSLGTAVRRLVSVQADELDILLMRFLDELVFHKDAEGLLVRARWVHVEKGEDDWHVQAELWGEPIDRERHELSADVKAVTLAGLRVERGESGWCARFTLDV